MKTILPSSSYVFSPGTGEISFSPIAATFDSARLLAIINVDYNGGTLIYSTAGGNATGGSFSGTTLTFNYNTGSMNPGDILSVIYDDPTAEQVIANDTETVNSGVILGALDNAINNTNDAYYCAPYRTAYVQMVQGSATQRMMPEGSMDGSVWTALPSRVIASTANPVSSAVDWTVSNSDAILAIPLDCNYVRLRIVSFGGNFRVQTYFTQQSYSSPWAFNMLLSSSGRVSDWGPGTSSAQTQRVVTSTDSLISIPDLTITGTGQSVANTNLLTGTTAGTDVSLYRSISFQIIGTSGVTGGAFIPEQSNDNTNWQACIYYQNNSSGPSLLTTAMNVSASFNQIYQASLTCRYFRIRISSTITGTSTPTITAHARLMPMTHNAGIQPIYGTVVPSGSVGLTSSQFGDFSGAISSTTTSGSTSTANIGTFSIGIPVTAVSGTNPTCDVQVQESFDGGTNWTPLYQFERITATGMYYSPPLRTTGTSIRYVRTIGGTNTPTFTMSSTRMTRPVTSTYVKNLVDRTIAPNTLNSTSPVLVTEGLEKFQLIVSSAAGATVNPVVKLQGSEDNANWYDMNSMSVTATPSTVVSANSGTAEEMPKFVRAIISTAGTSAVFNYIVIKGMGRP